MVRQHLRAEKLYSLLNFYFGVYSVVNYTGNYFCDLAVFLFEQKAKALP